MNETTPTSGVQTAAAAVTSAVVAKNASESKVRKLKRRLRDQAKPSVWVKDATIGSVAIVAIRITYVYLKALGARPELLAAMGPRLIIEILAVCIVGVLGNRGLDLLGDLLTRFVDAFDSGIDRMAASSERSAESSAATAIAQRDGAAAQQASAAAQRDLALAQQRSTAVVEKVAEQGDRAISEIQTLQNYQVAQGKIHLSAVKDNQIMLGQVLEHLGIKHEAKVEAEA